MAIRPIPQNVIKSGQFVRNIAEGIIESFLLFPIFAMIPFTVKVRWIFVLSLSAFLLLINALGIQGQSILQTLSAKRKYKKIVKKIYSYRRFKDGVQRDNADIIKNGKIIARQNNRGYDFVQSLMGR